MRKYAFLLLLLTGCHSNRYRDLAGMSGSNDSAPHYDKVVLYDCCVPANDPAVILLCTDLKTSKSHEIREDADTVLRASCIPN